MLKDCFISDLPKPIESNKIIANSKTDISFETTIDGFYSNVSYYEYLKNKNFNYFGIEGEVLNLKLLLIIKNSFYFDENDLSYFFTNRLVKETTDKMDNSNSYVFNFIMEEENNTINVENGCIFLDGKYYKEGENDDHIYSIETIYGRISIHSKDLFSLDDNYYKVISSNNFSHLFD